MARRTEGDQEEDILFARPAIAKRDRQETEVRGVKNTRLPRAVDDINDRDPDYIAPRVGNVPIDEESEELSLPRRVRYENSDDWDALPPPRRPVKQLAHPGPLYVQIAAAPPPSPPVPPSPVVIQPEEKPEEFSWGSVLLGGVLASVVAGLVYMTFGPRRQPPRRSVHRRRSTRRQPSSYPIYSQPVWAFVADDDADRKRRHSSRCSTCSSSYSDDTDLDYR